LVAVGVLVVGGIAATLYLDDIAAAVVQASGRAATGVATTVASASLRPVAGSLAGEGMVLATPEGFDTAHFLAIDRVECDITLGSLFAETVEIPLLAIRGVDLYLEQKPRGSNYSVILDYMKATGGKAPEDGGGKGKKWVIRELVIQDIEAHSDVALAGEKISRVDVAIDEIRLTNVGQDTGGNSEAEVIASIVEATLLAVVQQGHKVLPESVVNGLGVGLKQLPGLPAVLEIGGDAVELGTNAVEGAAKGVTGVLDSVFGGGGKKAEKPKQEKK
jgi:hypothetical protein